MLAVVNRDEVRATVGESFTESVDGYWYPVEGPEDRALVRIYLAPEDYLIERRRRPDAPWMPIVTASLSEFDGGHFRRWRDSWPVIA